MPTSCRINNPFFSASLIVRKNGIIKVISLKITGNKALCAIQGSRGIPNALLVVLEEIDIIACPVEIFYMSLKALALSKLFAVLN